MTFWVITVLATTIGETGGDAVSMSMNLGYAVSSAIFICIFLIAVAAQISVRKRHPFLLFRRHRTITAGTTMADLADRLFGVGYLGGTSLLPALLMILLFVCYLSEGSNSVSTVVAARVETF